MPDINLYDYEAPNGAEVLYRARARHTFEGGDVSVSDWSDTAAATWEDLSTWYVKHPTRPSLNLAIPRSRVTSQPGYTRPIRRGVHRILGRPDAVVTTDVRSSPEGDITFETESADEQAALEQLLEGPVLVQAPAGDNWPDRWCSFGDLDAGRLADKLRIADLGNELPWTEVSVPSGNLESLA